MKGKILDMGTNMVYEKGEEVEILGEWDVSPEYWWIKQEDRAEQTINKEYVEVLD